MEKDSVIWVRTNMLDPDPDQPKKEFREKEQLSQKEERNCKFQQVQASRDAGGLQSLLFLF